MMNQKIAKALNEQVIFEFNSAYLYLALSLTMADARFKGFSAWLRFQYQEEMDHAFKFVDYLESRGESVTLGDIKATAISESDPLKVAKMVYAHEQLITGKISDLYTLAAEEKDYATESMLRWFIDEQVEEEETAQSLIDALKMIKDNGFGLYTLDKELASRVYSPITTA